MYFNKTYNIINKKGYTMIIENTKDTIKFFEGNTCLGYNKKYYNVIETNLTNMRTFRVFYNDRLVYQKTIKVKNDTNRTK